MWNHSNLKDDTSSFDELQYSAEAMKDIWNKQPLTGWKVSLRHAESVAKWQSVLFPSQGTRVTVVTFSKELNSASECSRYCWYPLLHTEQMPDELWIIQSVNLGNEHLRFSCGLYILSRLLNRMKVCGEAQEVTNLLKGNPWKQCLGGSYSPRRVGSNDWRRRKNMCLVSHRGNRQSMCLFFA